MLAVVKFAAGAAAITIGAAQTTAPSFVLWIGVLVGVGAIIHQILAPAGRFIHGWVEATKILKRLESWMPEVDDRLEQLEAVAVNAENSAAGTARALDVPLRRHSRPRST